MFLTFNFIINFLFLLELFKIRRRKKILANSKKIIRKVRQQQKKYLKFSLRKKSI